MRKINWSNLIGIFLGFVGIIFGYYQYVDSKEEVDPTFISKSSKQQILSKELVEKAPIKILKASGEEIKGNVYSQTFYFFNQGKKAIKAENVIESLKLTLTDTTAKILDAKIIKLSRKVISPKLLIDTLSNSLAISFFILERDDGFEGQVIYVSQLEPELILDGAIEGAPKGFSTFYKGRYGAISIIINGLRVSIYAIFLMTPFILLAIVYFADKLGRRLLPAQTNDKKRGMFYWLTANYQMIIRNKDNYTEKTSVDFTYAKIVLMSAIIFVIFLLFSLLLVETVVSRRFHPKYDSQKIEVQVPETLI